MSGWVETLRELGAAWLMWAESFVHDAAQLPYRRAVVIAFVLGAVLAWFAAKEWHEGGDEDGEAEKSRDG